MRDYPLSPLVHAARGRVTRLMNGQDDTESNNLLQAAIKKQEAHIRFESSVCGPKAIEYLLPLLKKPQRDYKEIAQLCGTTDKGTSVDGLKAGLKALGLESFAFALNRPDFGKVATPAIWLLGDHYVVLLGVSATHAVVYDSLRRGERSVPLPQIEDPDFSATVLLFEMPRLEGQNKP